MAKLSYYRDEKEDLLREETQKYCEDKRISYQEYLQIVDSTEERYELIDGELYYLASPFFKHQVAVNEISGHLSKH